MPHLVSRTELIALALVVAVASTRAEAQASKVLIVPRSDTARPAAQAPKPATSAAAQTKATTGAQPPSVVPAPAPIAQGPVLDSIREVVFRNLLERDRAGLGTLAGAFCLGLSAANYKKPDAFADRVDPPDWMVRRVATSRAPARRASTCLFQPNAAATRPVPGRPLLYSIGAIDLGDGGRAEVAAGYNYDGYSAGGYTFSVERTDSAWVVKQWRLEWTGKP
jgi:hypothetical protein